MQFVLDFVKTDKLRVRGFFFKQGEHFCDRTYGHIVKMITPADSNWMAHNAVNASSTGEFFKIEVTDCILRIRTTVQPYWTPYNSPLQGVQSAENTRKYKQAGNSLIT